MATEGDTKSNLPPLNVEPVRILPDMVQPKPELNLIPPAPAANPLRGALMPAFLLMVFASCFVINPLGTGSTVKDEVLLAFFVFWFGALSLLCRPFLLARFPSVANAPAYILQFIHNCIFGYAPDP